jgi:hypothetical protein
MSATTPSELEGVDPDWSQVRETVVMLYLSAAQIEAAMHEGSQSVHRLTHAFETISTASNQLSQALSNSESDSQTTTSPVAQEAVAVINSEIQNSVVAFQFHDRISQRLHNVTNALHSLSDLINSIERMGDPDEWRQLQNTIKQSYSMESERLMFEHIMLGASVDDALAIYRHHFDDLPETDDSGDDIEVF